MAEEAANLKGKLTASETRIAQLADELRAGPASLVHHVGSGTQQ